MRNAAGAVLIGLALGSAITIARSRTATVREVRTARAPSEPVREPTILDIDPVDGISFGELPPDAPPTVTVRLTRPMRMRPTRRSLPRSGAS